MRQKYPSESRIVPSELVKLSSLIGKNTSLVQGAGGNTSYKDFDNDILWVKASGMWLANSDEENIFAALRLTDANRFIGQKKPKLIESTVIREINQLKPSIETSLHIIMPHQFVAHTHSVSALAWMIKKSVLPKLDILLEGIHWKYIPYATPGYELTQKVLACCNTLPEVLLLENHGIVTGADTVEEMFSLIDRLESVLFLTDRKTPAPDIEALKNISRESDYTVPEFPSIHSLATDLLCYELCCKGNIFPDQTVFLGPAIIPLESVGNLQCCNCNLVLVKDKGVLIHKRTSKSGHYVAKCLSDVLRRINEKDVVRYLSQASNIELIDCDAEVYRKAVDV